ncbi:diguanylate cyclase [Actinosynnema sp. CS-041913]|uniref:GGDEF domain-containing protein n=1 Tax=Actinosynnema sp. CS-041913 TaxID=3239917 RepID=UPI003D8EF7D6
MLIYLVLVEASAIVLTWILMSGGHPTTGDWTMLVLITAFGVVNAEVSRHVERDRRRFSDTPHVNLTSVWTFAAALLLPVGFAAPVVITLYLHLWWRSWYKVHGVHAYRLTFSAATVVLACHTAGVVQQLIGPRSLVVANLHAVWGIPLAIALYSLVNSGLIAGAIGLSERAFHPRRILGSARENALEYATLCLGVLAAILLAWKPALIALFFPVLQVMHRSVLIRQLEQAAASDAKTGLLNASAWHTIATAEFDRARRDNTTLGVLMIDLDHFKRINDQYGHLVGDRVLEAVAHTLKEEVRRYDVVGRFGGEEFVIALPGVEDKEIVDIAERICQRIRSMRVQAGSEGPEVVSGLSVSVGAATFPTAGSQLDQVLLRADNALFAAKDSGRDRVRTAMAPN